MPALTNPKHEAFAQAVAKGIAASKAYVAAGYTAKNENTAQAGASRLLSDVRVAARVAELAETIAQRVAVAAAITQADVLRLLMEDRHKALSLDNPNVSVAVRALELVGKHLGMFIERKEIGPAGAFDRMSEDELRESIAARLARIGVAESAAGIAGGTPEAGRKPH